VKRFLGSMVMAGALATALVAGRSVAFAAPQTRLLETGSSLLYPLFNLWLVDYGRAHADVQITTQSTGSGTGIAQAISGIAQIGASDAYMSNAQMRVNAGMLNIPLAISSQMINYNVPGLNGAHLRLSGPVLSGVYSGAVQYWDDPQLRKLNPDVSLPHQRIVPIHRTDGSGDTFIFTQFLSFSTPSWGQSIAYGTTVAWPAVAGGLGAQGNPGMVNASKNTPYSLAYIGISFKRATDEAGLGEARLQNRAGAFVLPDAATVQAAVQATAARTPADERISLIFAPGAQAYPIINYEYAIVNSRQPSATTAAALRQLLDWCIDARAGGSTRFMQAVGFVALPSPIAQLSRAQIAKLH
jgi:phosphate transport system substrate-binding protein